MKRKISLRVQITQILVIFVVLTTGLIFAFQSLFIDDIYKNNKIKSIEYAGSVVADHLYDGEIEEYVKEITTDDDVCIGIISSSGFSLSDSRRNACPLLNLEVSQVSDIANITKASGGEKLFDNYKFVSSKRNDLYIFSKLLNRNGEDILILVSTIVTPISAVSKTLTSQFMIIVTIVVFMAILLGLLLSRLIVTPINEIKKEATNLPDGKYIGDNINANYIETDELNSTLVEANEEILKAEKAKKELIANVSHDLRTPLTMIVGYGEMIKDFPDDDPKENAEIIIQEAKRLSSLVNDLLDVSKSTEMKLNLRPVSLNKLLKEVYVQYDKYCESVNCAFDIKLMDDVTVNVDEKRIKQVLYNLINNALNYNSKDDKKIVLGVEMIDEKHRIYVLDNGDGIAQKDIKKIWDRYYKVDKEHRRVHLGSGIGLSLAKTILENHHLEYGVESKINEYSKFYFDI